MTIKQAKENIMKNFRANYTNDHQDIHDIEIFLLNTMENLELVIKNEAIDVCESYNNHSSHVPEEAKEWIDEIRYEIEDFFDNGERRKDVYKYADHKVLTETVEKLVLKNIEKAYKKGRIEARELRDELEKTQKELEQANDAYNNHP